MKNITIIALLLLCLAAACSKYPDEMKDCIADKLAEFGMVEYEGQEKDCNSFLSLYNWNGKYYFGLGNYCVDTDVFCVFDCAGNELCGNEKVTDFSQNAVLVEIVGIEE